MYNVIHLQTNYFVYITYYYYYDDDDDYHYYDNDYYYSFNPNIHMNTYRTSALYLGVGFDSLLKLIQISRVHISHVNSHVWRCHLIEIPGYSCKTTFGGHLIVGQVRDTKLP